LLIARLGREECKQLDALLGDWDGHFSLEVRSKVTRHVESCKICRERRAILVAPANLLPSVVFIPAAADLRKRTLGSAAKPMKRIKLRRKLLGTSAIALVTVVTLGGAATLANVIGQTPPTSPTVLATGESTTTTTVKVDGPPAPAPGASGDHSPFEFENNPTTTVFLPADEPEEETTTTQTTQATSSLQLNVSSLNLGSSGTSAKVTLINTGGTATDWSSSHDDPVYQLSPSSGALAPGASVDITITLNRSGLGEGDIPDTVKFASDGTGATLTLAASVEVPPVIGIPTVSPMMIFAGGTCLQKTTTVTASVSDDSDIATVNAWWGTETEPFMGSFAMTHIGAGYQGEVGPFSEVPIPSPFMTIHVVAIDARGNQAVAPAPTTVEVFEC
jgi:hypothetical protein